MYWQYTGLSSSIAIEGGAVTCVPIDTIRNLLCGFLVDPAGNLCAGVHVCTAPALMEQSTSALHIHPLAPTLRLHTLSTTILGISS